MVKVLVVEDEASIRSFIVINLRRAGYDVIEAETGEEALERFRANPDTKVALLDIMLPGIDGFELMEYIRPLGIPVIFLTARGSVDDRVRGLRLGADDYIAKPFDPAELVARVKTQLRRYTRYNTGEAAEPRETAEHDFRGLQISRTTHKCVLFGEELALTPLEFAILWYLCEHRGQVVPSEELFEAVWGEKYMDSNNTVMSHIARLREKMHEPSRKPKFIKTVWGVGYTIE